MFQSLKHKPHCFCNTLFWKTSLIRSGEGYGHGTTRGKWQLKRAQVVKRKSLRFERGCSHRHQCLKAKARRITTINWEHLYYKAWRRGLGCFFSPLWVTLPLLISLLFREQAAGTSRSVDRCVAGQQSKGLSNLRCAWVTKSGCSHYQLGQNPSSKGFSGFAHLNYCCIFNQLLLMFGESCVVPLCILYLALRADNKIMQLLIYLQTPTTHFLTCEQTTCCLDKYNSLGTSRFSYRMYLLMEA